MEPDGNDRKIGGAANRSCRDARAGGALFGTCRTRAARPLARFQLAHQESLQGAHATSRNFAHGAGVRHFSAGRHSAQRVVLYDIELCVPNLALSVPNELLVAATDLPAVFAWSPTGRHLVAAWGAWNPALHIFDLHGKALLGTFGESKSFPAHLTWSDTGKYFAAGTSGGSGASLRLWESAKDSAPLARTAASEIGTPEWIEAQAAGAEFADEEVSGAMAARHSARMKSRSQALSRFAAIGRTIQS